MPTTIEVNKQSVEALLGSGKLFHLFKVLIIWSETRMSRFIIESMFQSATSEVPIVFVMVILEAVYSFFFLPK